MISKIIAKIKDFFASIVDTYEAMTKKERLILWIVNGVYLLLFYFIGIPRASLLTYIIGLIVVEAIFIFIAYMVMVYIIDHE